MFFSRRHQTEYVEINTNHCEACGKCVAACPEHVLGMIRFLSHRHACIDHAENCKGCRKCVKACENNAIKARPSIKHKKREVQTA